MIVWFAGLPGIGKSTFLARFVPNGWHHLQTDGIRDELALGRIADMWPPSAERWEEIMCRPSVYLAFYRELGSRIAHEHDVSFAAMRCEGRWVIEATPFVLAGMCIPGTRIFADVDLQTHIDRMATRFDTDPRSARAILDFYRTAFAGISFIADYHIGMSDLDGNGFAALLHEVEQRSLCDG
jgi:hypothetical protein